MPARLATLRVSVDGVVRIVEGEGAAVATMLVSRCHFRRVRESRQAAKRQETVQGLQHETVAAERHNDLCALRARTQG
jgi:hypothetical protein